MADLGGSVSGVVNVLGSVLGFFKGLGKDVARAIAGLGLQVIQLGKATASVFNHVGGLFGQIGGMFGRVWWHVINPALFWLVEAGKRVAHLLSDFFAPVLKLLKDARKQFLKYYNKFIRPITDTIDVVRKTFRVLGLLGVDSAKAIDQKLAAIEAKIQAPMLLIVTKLNEVTNYVNSIAGGYGLFARFALINSVLTYKRDVVSFGMGAIVRPLNEGEQRDVDTPYPSKPIEQHVDDLARAFDGRESYVRVRGQKYVDEYFELRAA